MASDSPYFQTIVLTPDMRLDAELNSAVEEAVLVAMSNPVHGVLVTRHDHKTYSVELTADVDYGITIERDLQT